MNDLVRPELSPTVEAFVRTTYGALLTGVLLLPVRDARRFFVSDRWGGYAISSPTVDQFQNPRILPVVMVVWLVCGVLIALGGNWSLPASLLNLLLCRYFF